MRAQNKIIAALVGTLAMIGFAGSASADLILFADDTSTAGVDIIIIDEAGSGTFSSGGTWQSNTAEDAGTLGTAGWVQYTGSVSTNWSITTLTSFGSALLGTGSIDQTVSALSQSAGTLVITLIETDLSGSVGSLINLILAGGGNTAGSVTMAGGALGDNGENFFAGAFFGPFGPGAFSSSNSINTGQIIDGGGLFSLFMQWTITHTTGQLTTGDYRLDVPEPATAALMGLALLGFGGARRRKQKVA